MREYHPSPGEVFRLGLARLGSVIVGLGFSLVVVLTTAKAFGIRWHWPP